MNRRKSLALAFVSLALAVTASLALQSKKSAEIAPRPSPATPSRPRELERDAQTTLSADQFTSLTAKVLRELPTNEDLRGLTEEEAHDTPEAIMRAGTQLGRIAQAVHDNPAFAGAAEDFYLRCARQDEVLMPVRALCYSHVPPDDENSRAVPAEVIRLARMIPAN